MTDERAQEITKDRLEEWEKTMAQWHATPVLLLAIGHDHVSGQIHVMTGKGVSSAVVESFLLSALRALQKGDVKEAADPPGYD